MIEQMRVMVYEGPHAVRVESREVPQPGSGEARIRIAYVGICGSDLHGYTGESGRRRPGMVMGHEASGWLDAVGPDTPAPDIGTLVTFNPSLPCDGVCGHLIDNHCNDLRVIGVTPEIQGAFADFLVVPVDRLVPLGGLDLVAGAAVEPMAVALQATRRADVRRGDDVIVFGGGMIGQCIARTARMQGAGSVVVCETLEERRLLAEASGFETVDPAGDTAPTEFNRSFDAVGITPTAAAAIRSVVKGGTVCFVGLGVPEVSVALFDIVVPERRIVGTFAYTDAVFGETVDHLRSGDLDLALLTGPTEPFERIGSAFEDLATHRRSDVKIMMRTDANPPEAGT